MSLSQVFDYRFDLQPGAKPKIGSGDRDETLTELLQHLSLEGLGPQWIRPRPPMLPIQDGEVRAGMVCVNYLISLLYLLTCLKLYPASMDQPWQQSWALVGSWYVCGY